MLPEAQRLFPTMKGQTFKRSRISRHNYHPWLGKYSNLGRDYEYRRLGTVSILADIDLRTGHILRSFNDLFKNGIVRSDVENFKRMSSQR